MWLDVRKLCAVNVYIFHIHSSPVFARLHWLLVIFRITVFYWLLLKHFHRLAPSCIVELLLPYEPGSTLESSARALEAVPESRLRTEGDRALAVKALQLWDSLPEALSFAESGSGIHKTEKTHIHSLCSRVAVQILWVTVWKYGLRDGSHGGDSIAKPLPVHTFLPRHGMYRHTAQP